MIFETEMLTRTKPSRPRPRTWSSSLKAKDLAIKAKDLALKAKDLAIKAKDLAFKAKARTFRCNPVDLHWMFDTINKVAYIKRKDALNLLDEKKNI